MKARLIEPMLDDGTYCWLIELGDTVVGVHTQNGWCMRIDERVIVLDTEGKFMPLGPLLDIAEADFSAFLKRVSKAAPALAKVVDSFPKETLLKHIFHTSYSSYWPERALEWLAADQDLWSKFRDELMMFATNKTMPQGARQRAQRMLRATESH